MLTRSTASDENGSEMFYSVIERVAERAAGRSDNNNSTTAITTTTTTTVAIESKPITTYYYILAGAVSMLPWVLTFCVFEYLEEFIGKNSSSAAVLVVQLPSVAANVWCACVTVKESSIQILRRRMYIGLMVQMFMISCIIFLYLFLAQHKIWLYYSCILFAFTLNFASAVFANSAYGLVMTSGRANIVSHQIGVAIGGLSIGIVYVTSADNRMSFIFYYLSMSLTLTLLCLVMTGHFSNIFDLDRPDVVTISDGSERSSTVAARQLRLLSNATRSLHCANLYALAFTTMNVYPGIFQSIVSTQNDVNVVVSSFSPSIVTFVVLNMASLVGALAVPVLPSPNDYVITAFVMLKVLMVPYFYLGNFTSPQDVHELHEVFMSSNDLYIAAVVMFGAVGGYTGTWCLVKISVHESGVARLSRSGRIAAAMIAIGSMSGLVISHYFIKLLQ